MFMNVYLILSGVLTTLMVIAHSVLGEKLIMIPLQKTEGLPRVRGSSRNVKMTLRFAWHITTVMGIGIACIFFYYSKFTEFTSDQIFVLRILSVTFFVSFIVSIGGARARHPSWIVMLVISILVWLSTN